MTNRYCLLSRILQNDMIWFDLQLLDLLWFGFKNCMLCMSKNTYKYAWFNCYRFVKIKIFSISFPSIIHSLWKWYLAHMEANSLAKTSAVILKHAFSRCFSFVKGANQVNYHLCLLWITRDDCAWLSSCRVFGQWFSHVIMFVSFPHKWNSIVLA